MARILDIFLNRNSNRSCKNYPDHTAFFTGLEHEEPEAIRCLSSKTSGAVFNIGKQYRLTDADIEELICDCITVCIQKIRSGGYVFQGYDPATYVVEIAKNKARNFNRAALKHRTEDMDSVPAMEYEDDFATVEETAKLEKLMDRLDASCRNLIRLKYLEELRDKDVIEKKLTQYTTVDALKNNRARCLKKLVELAKNASLLQ